MVYCHKNIQNGKEYIGITNDVKRRWSANGAHYKDSPKFWNAILKYGWDSFEHIILYDALSRNEAREKEIEIIKARDSVSGGYNISAGGDIPPVFYGESNHNYGKHFSDEVRQKMSDKHADFKGGKHPRAKAVICVETGKVYDTITEASIDVGVSRSCIRDVCNGKQEMSAECHWKYYDLDL